MLNEKQFLQRCYFIFSIHNNCPKQQDTLPAVSDTIAISQLPYAQNENQPQCKWIIPAAMVLYGFSTTHFDAFLDLNENTKNAIWIKYPHQNVTIDNYMQLVPAIAVYSLNFAVIESLLV